MTFPKINWSAGGGKSKSGGGVFHTRNRIIGGIFRFLGSIGIGKYWHGSVYRLSFSNWGSNNSSTLTTGLWIQYSTNNYARYSNGHLYNQNDRRLDYYDKDPYLYAVYNDLEMMRNTKFGNTVLQTLDTNTSSAYFIKNTTGTPYYDKNNSIYYDPSVRGNILNVDNTNGVLPVVNLFHEMSHVYNYLTWGVPEKKYILGVREEDWSIFEMENVFRSELSLYLNIYIPFRAYPKERN